MPMAAHCLVDALTEKLANLFVSEQWTATAARKRELVKIPWRVKTLQSFVVIIHCSIVIESIG
jgi:hypothetical protein